MIGLVLAAPMLVRIFAIPLVARVADRHDALRGGHRAGGCWERRRLTLLVGLADGAAAILRHLCAAVAGASRR